jgi:hypothetical protein
MVGRALRFVAFCSIRHLYLLSHTLGDPVLQHKEVAALIVFVYYADQLRSQGADALSTLEAKHMEYDLGHARLLGMEICQSKPAIATFVDELENSMMTLCFKYNTIHRMASKKGSQMVPVRLIRIRKMMKEVATEHQAKKVVEEQLAAKKASKKTKGSGVPASLATSTSYLVARPLRSALTAAHSTSAQATRHSASVLMSAPIAGQHKQKREFPLFSEIEAESEESCLS